MFKQNGFFVPSLLTSSAKVAQYGRPVFENRLSFEQRFVKVCATQGIGRNPPPFMPGQCVYLRASNF